MEATFLDAIKVTGYAIEAFGVLVIIIGAIAATATFLRGYWQSENGSAYLSYRQSLGRCIILGLELMIAGDIIRTVIVASSLEDVAILALIVLIRSFISLTLHLEVEGKLPWQPRQPQ